LISRKKNSHTVRLLGTGEKFTAIPFIELERGVDSPPINFLFVSLLVSAQDQPESALSSLFFGCFFFVLADIGDRSVD
jgi:hypothetical protein